MAAISAGVIPVPLSAQSRLNVEKSPWGKTAEGIAVERYTLSNAHGMRVEVVTYGATLTGVYVPDREGRIANVTLFLDTLEDYLKGHPLFGSVVGRYANRIAGAQFELDGAKYPVTRNSGKHHIHGGKMGFQRVVWSGQPVQDAESAAVEFRHTSPDGEDGYPGTLAARVTYRLNNKNELHLEYEATTDKPTHVNLTNHAYWNLAGAGSGDVLGHVLTLNADRYLPSDQDRIPQGPPQPVRGTPMDFTQPQKIGARIAEVGVGYDHCYELNKESSERLSPTARVFDPGSGRVMEVLTTQPGVQLYTANGLNDRFRGAGRPYGDHHGLCLETQHYPDSPNRPDFPTTVLRPGETYREVTIHRFSVER
jgi:aldose 1-epimerase